MTDLQKAIASARQAMERYHESEDYGVAPAAMHDLLAALDAQEPFGVAFQHNETGRTTCVPENEASDFARLNERWSRIGAVYLAPQAPPAVVRERVAIAICETFTEPKGVMWAITDEDGREYWRACAAAAIAAMLAAAEHKESGHE